MASNTYVTRANNYEKPDVSEIITNIAPDQTPLYTMLSKTKATGVIHEWLEDTLGEPADNKYTEGFTFFTANAQPRQILHNYTQIMSRGMQVTGTQEVVAKYGLKSEMGYQMNKVMKELAFDCERALINQPAPIIGSMTIPREFGGLPFWIVSNVFTAPAPGDFTFSLINSALESVYMVGGTPSVLLMSPRNKRIMTSFTANNTRYMEGNKTHKLTTYIDVLETDFGIVRALSDRFMPNDIVYGLSPEYIKKAFLRNFRTVDLPKDSDNLRKNVYGEWTVEMRAEKAHFKIDGLNGIVPAGF